MAVVQGFCDPKFDKLKAIFQEKLSSGEELGASIAVNIDGETVVDIRGGFVDEARTKPWAEDTIVNVYSSTKNISSLAVLMLHDRGLLSVDDKVSKHWPQFAANGKEDIKIRHLLSHSSGVAGWDEPISIDEFLNTELATERLAGQAPWWTPGTACGYHALTFGNLLGEIVKRVSGKPLRQFVAEEIAGPLGADFQIGAKESDWPRITNLIPPPPSVFDMTKLDPKSITVRTFGNPVAQATLSSTPEWRLAELGAVNGHGNARSLCQILSAITLGGSVNGHKLLSPKTIDRIFETQTDGVDLVTMMPIRFGIGYALAGGGTEQSIPTLPKGDRKLCFWGGWGGSWEVMDLDNKLTIAYTMNKMGDGVFGTERTWTYIKEIYSALETL